MIAVGRKYRIDSSAFPKYNGTVALVISRQDTVDENLGQAYYLKFDKGDVHTFFENELFPFVKNEPEED